MIMDGFLNKIQDIICIAEYNGRIETINKKQKKICIHLTLTTVMSTMLTKSILTGVYFLGIAHSK